MKRIKKTVIEFRRQPIETYETRLIIADNKILLACMAVREITAALKDRFRWYLKP